MNRKQEILKEMARDIANYKGGFEDLDTYETIEDLCNELFSENPAEAARAMYFGEISGWNTADGYILDDYGNIKDVDNIGEKIDGQEEEIVSEWLSLDEDDRDNDLIERYWNAGGEYGTDSSNEEDEDDEEE